MQLFCLKNLSDQVISSKSVEEVSELQNPRPSGLTKEKFREWGTTPTANGLFYSVWSGSLVKGRINQSNPAVLLHGIIGDYDSTAAKSKLMSLPTSVSVMPAYFSDTFTEGKVRLLWPFEEPVVVGDELMTAQFLKELDSRIRFSKALPGFDKSSLEPTQYFEQGTNWCQIEPSSPIPKAFLDLAMIDAASKLSTKREVGAIPLEKVAAEVERQFSGRWKKPFEVGQRGPLFWIPDGIDREGCIVTEHGMVSYSDRAESNFLPWKRILGPEFVKEFEQEIIGVAASDFYCDNKSYYRKIDGRWQPLSETQARMRLRVLGVSDIKRKGQCASDQDFVLSHVGDTRRVHAAAPITFRSEDIVHINGERILNLTNKKALPPAPEGQGHPDRFPWLWEYFNNIFDDVEGLPRARDVFFGWLWWFYSTALKEEIEPGQVLIIAGPASLGKSLLNIHVIGEAVGGSYDAKEVLMNKTSFNKQAGECGHWRVDDVPNDGSYQVKRAFTQNLKSHAANPTLLYQPKYADSLELPHLGRICVTCNLDAESIAILPTMDGSVADKIILMKLTDKYTPKFHASRYTTESMIAEELPYFLRWLLDWGENMPEELLDRKRPRYCIKPYHHPELVAQSHAETPEYGLQELLEIWAVAKAKDKEASGEYTASEILQELRSLMPEAARDLKSQSFGRLLTKLVSNYRRLTSKRVVEGVARYTFNFKQTA